MILNHENVNNFFRVQKKAFMKAFAANMPALWPKIATEVKSSTETSDYGWIGEVPHLREWVGQKIVNRLKAHSYSLTNVPYEVTVGVHKHKLQDDQFGIYTTFTESMARSAGMWVDKRLVFQALIDGVSTNCYDGQFFFDTDHPVAGSTVSNTNTSGGGSGAWYLLDTNHVIKPLIFQNRQDPTYWDVTSMSDGQVALDGEFKYGVEARGTAGYGLWQTAYRSDQALTSATFRAARLAMRGFTNDEGQEMGIDPNIIVVGRANEDTARDLFGLPDMTDRGGSSGTTSVNPERRAVELVVAPWLP